MRRILAKYNEAQDLLNRNSEKGNELKGLNIKPEITKEELNEKLNICKKKIIQNNIQEDLINRMKDEYLLKTNYSHYNNTTNEIKDIYEEIYTKIFDIQKEQKKIKKEYDDLLYLINL